MSTFKKKSVVQVAGHPLFTNALKSVTFHNVETMLAIAIPAPCTVVQTGAGRALVHQKMAMLCSRAVVYDNLKLKCVLCEEKMLV